MAKAINRRQILGFLLPIFVVLALVLLSSCTSIPTTAVDRDLAGYLQQNAKPIKLESSPEVFSALDAVYSGYGKSARVFLSGERHASTANFATAHMLFDYFRDRFNATTYLSERGVASGFLIDRYLRTGDKKIIDAVMSMIASSTAHSQEQAASFRHLRNVWVDQPEKDRFRYIGVDIEHALGAPVAAVSLIAETKDEKDMPAEIKAICDLACKYWKSGFPRWGHRDEPAIRTLISDLHESIETGEIPGYYFGNDAGVVHLMLDSAMAAYAFYDLYRDGRQADAFLLRESAIMRQFNSHHELASDPETVVYFGQWGGFHVLQNRVYGEVPFAAMLAAPGGMFEDQVISTAIFYDRSRYFDPIARQPKSIQDNAGRIIGSAVDYAPVAIRLDLPGSPLARDLYFVEGVEKNCACATTDFIQVALVVRGSQAATPYRAN